MSSVTSSVAIPLYPTAIMPDAVFKFLHSLYHDATASVQNVLLALIAAVLTWSCWSAFYNVYSHPLARFPGPKLAAASKYWLFYQEFVKGVSLSDVRDKLHAQYGAFRFSATSAAPRRHPINTPLAINRVDAGYWHVRFIQVTLFEYNPIWYVSCPWVYFSFLSLIKSDYSIL